MAIEEKLNCISRLIILFSLLLFFFTFDFNAIVGGFIAILIVIAIHHSQKTQEGFQKQHRNSKPDKHTILPTNPNSFHRVSSKNPLGNVLLTEISDNPHRKAAPPCYDIKVNQNINRATKNMVKDLNPGIKEIDKKLFGGIDNQHNFELSQQRFYSTANTRVENNQAAFANWLYGDMPSSKENNPFALEKNNPRYTLF
jgi:hypothetical protein